VKRCPSEIRSTSSAIASTACSIHASLVSVIEGTDSLCSRAASFRCAIQARAKVFIEKAIDPIAASATTTFPGSSIGASEKKF
jgi:hypothetical protein